MTLAKSFSISFLEYSYSYFTKGFDPVRALSNVTIRDVTAGEIVCIIGPNGSGKTTFLDAITGRLPLRKDQGRIVFTPERSGGVNVAYIPQKPSEGFVPDLSIIENLIMRRNLFMGFSLKKAVTRVTHKEIQDFLTVFGFDFLIEKLEMPPSSLSGGEQQIVNVLASIFSEPDVIVLDEPTSKIDEVNRVRLWNLILEAAHKKHTAVLCASHDHDMVERVADRIITLDNGVISSEQNKRIPLAPRHAGEIRFAETKALLPPELQKVSDEWWNPEKGQLFDTDYFTGDNSFQGYLAKRNLTREKRTLREVDGVLRIAGVPANSGKAVLDVPCGWGRHSLEIATRGYKVIGVDLSTEYIKMAQQALTAKGAQDIEFKVGDMRNLPLPANHVDLIINMWTSFGFFDDDQNMQVLREFNRVLKSGGKVVIHSDLNPERIRTGIFDEPSLRDLESGQKLEVKEYYCADDHRVYGSWHVSGSQTTHTYKIAIYTQREWSIIAVDAGFTLVSCFGSFDKSDDLLSARSQEYIVLLNKK